GLSSATGRREGDAMTRLLRSLWRAPSARRPSRQARLRLERLELPVAPAFGPVGVEFRVNTYTTLAQDYHPLAVDADGDSVVVWQSNGQDGSGVGVYAQRYSSGGGPLGGEFRVNTFTTSGQLLPAVAMDAAGDVVVAWTSYLQDG